MLTRLWKRRADMKVLLGGKGANLAEMKRLGIPDKFAEHYGSQAKLMEEFRFDAKGIDTTVRKHLAEREWERMKANDFAELENDYVETAECLAQLREMDCDTVQGWLIGHPLPTDAFAALLESRFSIKSTNRLK